MDPRVLEKIDLRASQLGLTRTRWIEEACKAVLSEQVTLRETTTVVVL